MITSISVSGMPARTPGMGGPKREPRKVYYISRSAEPKVYGTF
ncbi:hypothetical protein [Pseudomonas sp. 2FE]|nr:hypothetical protein [Pseudomonas sp. 2FE]